MRGKIVFVVGLATGYVLGTRAGRERYEQIKAGADKVWNTPTVQAGVEKVQEFAGARVDVAKAKLSRQARNALASLIGREPLSSPAQSSSRPAAKSSSSSTAARKPAARKPAASSSSSSSAASASKPAAKPSQAKASSAKADTTTTGTESSDSAE
jgi:hypothetical protein